MTIATVLWVIMQQVCTINYPCLLEWPSCPSVYILLIPLSTEKEKLKMKQEPFLKFLIDIRKRKMKNEVHVPFSIVRCPWIMKLAVCTRTTHGSSGLSYIYAVVQVTDPCYSAPCQGGSTCIDLTSSGGNYRCECSPGLTGTNCDQPLLQPCSSAPCRYDSQGCE